MARYEARKLPITIFGVAMAMENNREATAAMVESGHEIACHGWRCMAGMRLPIAVAHGEGYANFAHRGDPDKVIAAMRFTNHQGEPTETYPLNPNGSPGGLTAVTTADGRITAMMPHAERVFRNVQMSWTAGDKSEFSPWLQIWRNARQWVG